MNVDTTKNPEDVARSDKQVVVTNDKMRSFHCGSPHLVSVADSMYVRGKAGKNSMLDTPFCKDAAKCICSPLRYKLPQPPPRLLIMPAWIAA